MREIKFRAYLTLSGYDADDNDKDYHAMATKISVHDDGGIGFSVEHGHEIFEGDAFERAMDMGTISEYEGWCLWEGPFELMQYTGLKDKNGVEIYEGDIIKAKHDDGRYDTGEVVYGSKGAFCLYLPEVATGIKKPLLNYIHGIMLAEHDFEVIGNIYENPELLK